MLGAREDRLRGELDRGRGGLGEVRERAVGDAREHRRARARRALAEHGPHRAVRDIGLDLQPQRGARAAADDADLVARELERGEPVDDVAQRVGAALEHRARQVRGVVAEREPGEAPAHAAVPARRGRARERGEEERAVRAGRGERGEAEQLGLRDALRRRPPLRAAAGDEAGVLDQQHLVDRVRVGLDHALVVEDGLARRDRDRLGGAGDVDDHARRQRARAERARVVVAGADDHAAVAREPERVGRPRAAACRARRPPGGSAGSRVGVEAGVTDEVVAPGTRAAGRRAASRTHGHGHARPRR